MALTVSAANSPALSNPVGRQSWPGLIEAYRQYLPVTDTTPVVTLLEGNTPLIPVPAI
ncbi:threonine synthase, partial [Coleofasciculus sp. FACHB-SPT36]|nr:threonine synthase [Coleofasciculus sp. FACHB-SPT36]